MRSVRFALAAAALFFTGGCVSDLVTGGPLLRPGEPTGALIVANGSRAPMNVVLISACSASTYGLNRLPSGAYIPPGSSYTFTVSAGCWDVAGGSTSAMQEGRQRLNVAPGRASRVTFR
jgi:hypothetical protein